MPHPTEIVDAEHIAPDPTRDTGYDHWADHIDQGHHHRQAERPGDRRRDKEQTTVTITDATTPVEEVELPIGPEARGVIAALAVQHATDVLARPVDWSSTGMALHAHRRALRLAARQLSLLVRSDPDPRPPLCGGTGAFVPEEAVDGSATATCPTCRRYRHAVAIDGRWWAITEHPTRHAAACLASGPIRCVCPLHDNEEPF